MKIIDNKKDYYDYLQGVNGIDPLKIYDRRGSVDVKKELDRYWDIKKYSDILTGSKDLRYILDAGDRAWIIEYDRIKEDWYCKECSERIRTEEDAAPIELTIDVVWRSSWWMSSILNRCKNPILRDLKIIRRFIKPDMIWNALYEYFGRLKDGNFEDTRNDIQKLESYGFDKKTSFRNIK